MDKEKMMANVNNAKTAAADGFNKAKGKFMAFPKKTRIIIASAAGGIAVLFLALICAACLFLFGDSKIELIQKGCLGSDPSITFADALNKNMKNIEWKKESDDVIITGKWNTDYYSEFLTDYFALVGKKIDEESEKLHSLEVDVYVSSHGGSRDNTERLESEYRNKKSNLDEIKRWFQNTQRAYDILNVLPRKGDNVYIRFRYNKKDNSFSFVEGQFLTPDHKIKTGESEYASGVFKGGTYDGDIFLGLVYCNKDIRSKVSKLNGQIDYTYKRLTGARLY